MWTVISVSLIEKGDDHTENSAQKCRITCSEKIQHAKSMQTKQVDEVQNKDNKSRLDRRQSQ